MNNSQTDILEGLNSAQRGAVTCTEGPSLIVAGAGSGKTRVLTCRVAQIIASGCRPGEILALTFTNKAAKEMKERISQLVGENRARWIFMGTFHSIFIRFLREYASCLGYPEHFTIYDQTDSRSLIKQCVRELELDDKIYKPAVVGSRISLAKNNLITVGAYKASAEYMESDRAARKPRLADVYELYQKKCKAAGAMDFDDILLNMNILLRDFPDARESIASRFRYILVDEYQDTNHSQYAILRRLAEPHHNICVVGDDAQSIYGFRGARIENILRFKKDYPQAQEFRLEQNYRSTQVIVNAANSLISHNSNRLKKECFSKADLGEKIDVIKAFTEAEEAYLIASSIVSRIYSDKVSYDSFAILYRTNAQSRALEESLRKRNLPYRIYGSHSFYERAEIRDFLAYFKLVVNPSDDEAFRRIVNVPARGIGGTSLDRLAAVAAAEGCTLFDACLLPSEKLVAGGLREASVRKFREFSSMIDRVAQDAPLQDCYATALEIGNMSGYLAALHSDTSPEGISRFENSEELFNSIKDYMEEETELRKETAEDQYNVPVVTLGDYLENVSLLSESEKDDTQDPDLENNNKITLMTVHASKGLEFPYVYIAGMEENLFPSEQTKSSPMEIEEERRLFYVAITRAMKCVTVSYAQNRRKWGSEESNPPSRFLKEIDSKYLSQPIDDSSDDGFQVPSWKESAWPSRTPSATHSTPRQPARPQSSQSTQTQHIVPISRPAPAYQPSANFKPSPVSDLREGQRVEHDRFGFGTIISFDGDGAGRKAVVDFEMSGQKTLLLKFARLRIAK